MKKISMLILGAIFLIGGGNLLAVETPRVIGTAQETTIHIEYVYSGFGVLLSSTQTTSTITTTDLEVTAEDGTVTEEQTVAQTDSVTDSAWKGGSLKAVSTTGTSVSDSDDGSTSTTDFETTYAYDENGRIVGAEGTSDSTSESTDPEGSSESSGVDTYIIKDGQTLRSQSEISGIRYGIDGEETAEFTETSTYEYELIGGSWQLIEEVTVSTSDGTDGSTQVVTKTKTYERDENGVCTGIDQEAEGEYSAVNQNGGTETYVMTNYIAEFDFDDQMGWYLALESWDWELQ